jgi:hypothetical protein
VEPLIAQVRRAVRIAGDKVSQELTQDLRKHVVKHGWSPELAEFLEVTFDNDGGYFSINILDSRESDVHDAEYGNGDDAPRPALRIFENRMNQTASPRLDELLQEELIREKVL